MTTKDPWVVIKDDDEFPQIYKCADSIGNGCGASIGFWHIVWAPASSMVGYTGKDGDPQRFRVGFASFSGHGFEVRNTPHFSWWSVDEIDSSWVKANDMTPEQEADVKRLYCKLKSEGKI